MLIILFGYVPSLNVHLHGSEVEGCEAAVVTIMSGNINTHTITWNKKIRLLKKSSSDGKSDHDAHA